jgi:xylan 1,4-beta-xylosidase
VPVRLRFDLDGGRLRASCGETEWGPFDASILSDEYARESDGGDAPRAWGFTGAFFGLWVQDLTGGGLPADFSAATYQARP